VAPGTVASAATALVLWLLGLSSPALAVVLGAVAALGVWAADQAERALAAKDPGAIVIDEVAGMTTAALFVPSTWLAAGMVFVIFRVFDVLKPYPAGLIDRRGRGGFGVVGDDLVAGAYAGIVTRIILEAL